MELNSHAVECVMPIVDLYSRRNTIKSESDVYVYDYFPTPLINQILYCISDVFGFVSIYDDQYYKIVVDILRREFGVRALTNVKNSSYKQEFEIFFRNPGDVNSLLDALECCCIVFDVVAENHFTQGAELAAIEEINSRLKQHSVGYRFCDGIIVKVDSELLHSEVVVPALNFLSGEAYAGPNSEFLKAHEHFRHSNYHECLNECHKAFESTMKVICSRHGWSFDPTWNAAKLIDVCMKNELVSKIWQSKLTSLGSLLISSIPTGRNKISGHGKGTEDRVIPEYLAAYMLHMTASTILFLVESDKALV
jgi:hypothetical protein